MSDHTYTHTRTHTHTHTTTTLCACAPRVNNGIVLSMLKDIGDDVVRICDGYGGTCVRGK